MAKEKNLRHLTVLLLKKQHQDPNEVLIDISALRKYELKTSLPFKGVFFAKEPHSKAPSWLSFVQEGLNGILDLVNMSSSGVLFIRESSRFFVLTFGHGRYLLNQNAIERDFGLKVTLNAVNPDKLRSIDMSSLEELPVQTRRQTSVSSSLDIFGIDIDRDVLRAVTGKPREIEFAESITGADALAISSRLDFPDLGEKCKKIMNYYKSTKYQNSFSWIDRIKAVREAGLVSKLDALLSDMINKGDIDNIYLAPPEPLDWETLEGFHYSCDNNKTLFADLDINQYYEIAVQSGESINVDTLKSHRVEAKYVEIEELFAKWFVYDCLVLQVGLREHLYVLSRGQWFQVEKQFAAGVFKDVKAIKCQNNFLIKAKKGEKEGDYNERAAQSASGMVLLDKKDIKTTGAASAIEVCDLLSRDKQFIHVKKKTRSSLLSHLFFQGSNSAELFLRDNMFRDKLKSLLRKQKPNLSSLVPSNRPDASEYTVVYAIITDGKRKLPDSLPFFSQLSLRQQVQRLQGYRFNVLLARIIEE